MFDLGSDPYEQVNLAHNSVFRERRRELNERLRSRLEDLAVAFELPEL